MNLNTNREQAEQPANTNSTNKHSATTQGKTAAHAFGNRTTFPGLRYGFRQYTVGYRPNPA